MIQSLQKNDRENCYVVICNDQYAKEIQHIETSIQLAKDGYHSSSSYDPQSNANEEPIGIDIRQIQN